MTSRSAGWHNIRCATTSALAEKSLSREQKGANTINNVTVVKFKHNFSRKDVAQLSFCELRTLYLLIIKPDCC